MSRQTTWEDGDILTATALNDEFDELYSTLAAFEVEWASVIEANLTFLGDAEDPDEAKILFDKTNTQIRVGALSDDHLIIDGDYSGEPAIRSSNYVSGAFGAGFILKSDLLEVGNIAARGIIRTAVFQKDVVSAVGGNLAVLPADLLNATMSADDYDDDFIRITEAGDTRITEAGDTRILEGFAVLTIEGNETFASGDILRIKDGTYDEWIEIGLIDDAPTYAVIRDKAGSYADGSNPAWPKGASVVNYGQSGDGGIYMTASEFNAPYLSIFTHAGEPWDTITTHIREGNLNGYAGYETDTYGWASYIDANNYIKIDPINGIRMSGEIVITGGSMPGLTLDDLADGSTYGRVAKTAISAGKIVLTSSGVTGTLPTTLTEAKCTDANADQTSANTAAAIAGQGTLATMDEGDIELDNLTGTTKATILQTVIDSGYLYLLRRSADSAERLEITAGGIEGYANNVKVIDIANTPSITVGEVGASKSNVHITSGAVQLRNNTTPKLTLAADGSMTLDGGITTGSAGWFKVYDDQATPVLRVHLGYIA